MFIDLNAIYDLLESKTETCGFLTENGDVIIDSFGTDVNGRGMCSHSRYETYMWHTHPYSLKSYPSAEDILYVLKKHVHNKPRISLIFTAWGIWELYALNKLNIDQNWYTYLYKTAQDAFNGLYHITGRGKDELTTNTLAYLQITLIELTYNINRKYDFGFQISFVPWNKTEGLYKLRFV